MQKLALLLIIPILLLAGCTSAPSTSESDNMVSSQPELEPAPQSATGQEAAVEQEATQQQPATANCNYLGPAYTVDDAAALLGSEFETQGPSGTAGASCALRLDSGSKRIRVQEELSFIYSSMKSQGQVRMISGIGDEAFISTREDTPGARYEYFYMKKGTRYFYISCEVDYAEPCTDEQLKSIAETVLSRLSSTTAFS